MSLRPSALAFALVLLLVPAVRAQQTPPAPGPPRPLTLPAPAERTLSNGLRVLVVERPGLPLVTVQLLVRSGAEVDPPGRDGAAQLTAALLTQGTATRTAPEIAQAMESLGATLNTGAGWDASSLSTTVMTPNLDPALALLADAALRPAFADEELERLRAQTLDGLQVELADPSAVATRAATRLVYGTGPYGHPAGGTPASVERLTRDDVVALHRAYYRPDNAILVFSGALTAADAFALAERHFGAWARPAGAVPQPALTLPTATATATRVIVIDMPEAGQAAVVAAHPAPTRTDPAYVRGLVTNSVLGGGYSSRLNLEVRIRRGLSYGAFSDLDYRRGPGLFYAATQTKNESGDEVVAVILTEFGRLGAEGMTAAELTPRKAALVGGFARGLETSAGVAGQFASLALYGIGLDATNRFVSDVEAVTSADVQAFAAAHLDAPGTVVVVAGNAAEFLDALRIAHPDVEVIPATELNLDSPTLR
ncbi:MAG TPA: pitrilysin family protein [Rhodothermales bacterium]|nr:pitrilysin family protein [Rhodothermales bacterium]